MLEILYPGFYVSPSVRARFHAEQEIFLTGSLLGHDEAYLPNDLVHIILQDVCPIRTQPIYNVTRQQPHDPEPVQARRILASSSTESRPCIDQLCSVLEKVRKQAKPVSPNRNVEPPSTYA